MGADGELHAHVGQALSVRVAPAVAAAAAAVADATPRAAAVLFYGSNLRTGAFDGVLDFYVLQDGPAERGLWPTVSYRELPVAGATLRLKIATMSLATFSRAAGGGLIDTTIWTRFVQPAAIAWRRDERARAATEDAVADAIATAARFAAALGPARGAAVDYWRALFRQTYAAELRVEKAGREEQIVAHDAARYDALLPLGWAAGGVRFEERDGLLAPSLTAAERARPLAAWRRRRRWGRPLNALRLVRAAWTFEGAGAYGAWKVERHTGVRVPLTRFRERHPVLAAPGVLWRVWREKRRGRTA